MALHQFVHSTAARVALATLLFALLLSGCKKQEQTGVDLSNPRAAAISFISALEKGDAPTARKAASAGGIEWDLVDAMADATSGMRALRAAAVKRFGKDADRIIDPRTPLNVSAKLKEADVAGDENTATVTPKDGQIVIHLKHDEEGWKVDVGTLTRGQDITDVIPSFHAVGKAAATVGKEIDDGKYNSVAEVQAALDRASMAELARQRDAATAPSTMP
jgi:hypothetical protein